MESTYSIYTTIIAASLYLYAGWQSWLILGLTSTDDSALQSGLNMLRMPESGVARAAFITVFVAYVTLWPIWLFVGHVSAALSDRASRRSAPGCTTNRQP